MHLPDIGPQAHLDVAADSNAGVMPVVFVGPRDQVGPAPECLIGDDPRTVDTDGPQTPRVRPEERPNLFGSGGAGFDRGRRIEKLLLLEIMVTPEQHQHLLTVENIDQGLDLTLRSCNVGMSLGQSFDRS